MSTAIKRFPAYRNRISSAISEKKSTLFTLLNGDKNILHIAEGKLRVNPPKNGKHMVVSKVLYTQILPIEHGSEQYVS